MFRLLWTRRGTRIAPHMMRHELRRGRGLSVPPRMRVRTIASIVIPFLGGQVQVVRLERDEVN